MSGADWKNEALGALPVWPGALFYDDRDLRDRWGAPVPAGPNKPQVCVGVEGRRVLSQGGLLTTPLACCVLALDSPDTRVAFVRRLALQLGCPEPLVDVGVMVYPLGPQGCWVFAAGGRTELGWAWSAMAKVETDDPLVALVRAWKIMDTPTPDEASP